MKAIAEIEINEETLNKNQLEGNSVEEKVEREFGWLEASGIYLDSIKIKEE